MNHLLLHFRAVLVPALKHFYDSIGVGTTIKTTLLPFEGSADVPDLTTIYESTNYTTLMLPLHPDVVIHYRCSDNINFKWMGLTQFHTILNLIPTDSRYIIILTEGTPLGLAIISALRKRILAKFPSLEQVLIRHGGSVFSPIVSLFIQRQSSAVQVHFASTLRQVISLAKCICQPVHSTVVRGVCTISKYCANNGRFIGGSIPTGRTWIQITRTGLRHLRMITHISSREPLRWC